MPRRVPWALVVAAALVVLLAALATLQYRWLGEVSQAERERMRAGLQTRATDFTDAFDRELTHAYVAFRVEGDALSADPARTLAAAFAAWQAGAMAPAMVQAVYEFDGPPGASSSLMRLDPVRGTLDRVDWPASLQPWRARATRSKPELPGIQTVFLADALESSVPALIVNVPAVTRIEDATHVEVFEKPGPPGRTIVVELNADRLRRDLIDPLVVKYFGSGPQSQYLVTIASRSDPSHIVYTSDPLAPPLDALNADVTAGLFDLRVEEIARSTLPNAVLHREFGGQAAKMAITIVHRTSDLRLSAPGGSANAWQARVRYRSGSLEAIVSRSRRRNVALGAGVLGLLVASIVLIIGSAQRQQRLARQQIEFVAAVSHELRTPLAVIRSAGENLADGIVAGDEHVKRYGALIESEGRRLTDMVERVMEFAGIASGRSSRGRAEVDLSRAIEDAVGGVRAEARERGLDVRVHVDGSLPTLIGDADAIRSALHNVIGNAVKYSSSGGTIEVRASAEPTRVLISVVDRGIGIDADDLPHIFKPFFRGRRAADAQIRGTGIGLSVVRHVVDAHHGQVDVTSAPGEGTTVVIALPVSAPPNAQPATAAAGRVSA